MKTIRFKAAYGDEVREVMIRQVSGSLNTIHIYIDDYYSGSINYVLDKWVVHWVEPVPKSVHQELYGADDSEAILDRLQDVGWID